MVESGRAAEVEGQMKLFMSNFMTTWEEKRQEKETKRQERNKKKLECRKRSKNKLEDRKRTNRRN